ncbi:MAG: hypothetical protein B6I32_04550 [Desulfobacterium sp. 4572_20]|nr:MAG: hypothetical protein B6I32_04550 [Desulfobacterium sp. 4572_20]
MSIELIALIMFVSLVVLLLTGLPLVFVLGGLAMVFSYFLWGPNSMLLVALQAWRVMTTYSFVAIPLYIFMAVILQRSGGGTLGILIPPSVITVVYAVTAGVSIGRMFMGGVGPGLLLAALFIIYIAVRCWLRPDLGPAPSKEERQEYSFIHKLLALRAVILPMILIIGVLGSIYAGIASPTEAAGVGCIGAILSAAIYRRLTWLNIKDSVYSTAKTTAMILWITIGARCFISVFSAVGGDELIMNFVSDLAVNRWIILILIQFMLIFLGLFLDEIGIILLCVPIFLPIIKALSFDPIWFGILFLVNAQMDYITPPFGYTLFYLKGVAPKGVTMGDIYRSIIPFVLLQALGLALCIIFPQIVLWLPNIMK